MIYLEADFVDSAVEEEHFVELIELSDERDALLLPARLEDAEEAQHEVLVLLILPSVEGRLMVARRITDAEESPETLKKLTIEVIPVDDYLRLLRQFIEQSQFFVILESDVPVHGPLVLEECFDVPFECQINRLVVIVLLENAEEASQLVTVVDLSVEILELIQNLSERSHDE